MAAAGRDVHELADENARLKREAMSRDASLRRLGTRLAVIDGVLRRMDWGGRGAGAATEAPSAVAAITTTASATALQGASGTAARQRPSPYAQRAQALAPSPAACAAAPKRLQTQLQRTGTRSVPAQRQHEHQRTGAKPVQTGQTTKSNADIDSTCISGIAVDSAVAGPDTASLSAAFTVASPNNIAIVLANSGVCDPKAFSVSGDSCEPIAIDLNATAPSSDAAAATFPAGAAAAAAEPKISVPEWEWRALAGALAERTAALAAVQAAHAAAVAAGASRQATAEAAAGAAAAQAQALVDARAALRAADAEVAALRSRLAAADGDAAQLAAARATVRRLESAVAELAEWGFTSAAMAIATSTRTGGGADGATSSASAARRGQLERIAALEAAVGDAAARAASLADALAAATAEVDALVVQLAGLRREHAVAVDAAAAARDEAARANARAADVERARAAAVEAGAAQAAALRAALTEAHAQLAAGVAAQQPAVAAPQPVGAPAQAAVATAPPQPQPLLSLLPQVDAALAAAVTRATAGRQSRRTAPAATSSVPVGGGIRSGGGARNRNRHWSDGSSSNSSGGGADATGSDERGSSGNSSSTRGLQESASAGGDDSAPAASRRRRCRRHSQPPAPMRQPQWHGLQRVPVTGRGPPVALPTDLAASLAALAAGAVGTPRLSGVGGHVGSCVPPPDAGDGASTVLSPASASADIGAGTCSSHTWQARWGRSHRNHDATVEWARLDASRDGSSEEGDGDDFRCDDDGGAAAAALDASAAGASTVLTAVTAPTPVDARPRAAPPAGGHLYAPEAARSQQPTATHLRLRIHGLTCVGPALAEAVAARASASTPGSPPRLLLLRVRLPPALRLPKAAGWAPQSSQQVTLQGRLAEGGHVAAWAVVGDGNGGNCGGVAVTPSPDGSGGGVDVSVPLTHPAVRSALDAALAPGASPEDADVTFSLLLPPLSVAGDADNSGDDDGGALTLAAGALSLRELAPLPSAARGGGGGGSSGSWQLVRHPLPLSAARRLLTLVADCGGDLEPGVTTVADLAVSAAL